MIMITTIATANRNGDCWELKGNTSLWSIPQLATASASTTASG